MAQHNRLDPLPVVLAVLRPAAVLVDVHARNIVDEHPPGVPLLANQGLDEGPHVGVVANQALHSAVIPFQAVVRAAA